MNSSMIERKIRGLKEQREKWGIVFFNALSHQRMAQAERYIKLIDAKLERLEAQR
jgi:hypothetical protein